MGFILVIQNTLITLSDLYLLNNSVTQVTTNQIRQDLSLVLTFVRNGRVRFTTQFYHNLFGVYLVHFWIISDFFKITTRTMGTTNIWIFVLY